MSPSKLRDRFHRACRHLVHLDDTPHRIALGVFLGFLVGWTPSLGMQLPLYWLLAILLGANRLAGLVPMLVANPFTAVPLYYAGWAVGRLLLIGTLAGSQDDWLRLMTVVESVGARLTLESLFEATIFAELGAVLVEFGRALWVGCLALGMATGLAGYGVTYHFVARRHERLRRGEQSGLLDVAAMPPVGAAPSPAGQA